MIFIITTSPTPGARLSKPGHWGGVPFPDIAAAEAHARELGATEIRKERGNK